MHVKIQAMINALCYIKAYWVTFDRFIDCWICPSYLVMHAKMDAPVCNLFFSHLYVAVQLAINLLLKRQNAFYS